MILVRYFEILKSPTRVVFLVNIYHFLIHCVLFISVIMLFCSFMPEEFIGFPPSLSVSDNMCHLYGMSVAFSVK